jgi:hypothetical protein
MVERMASSDGIVIDFARVKQYLNAIADANGEISTSPHKRFWSVAYQAFVGGQVPNVAINGHPVPIIDESDPVQSPFFLILQGGWSGLPQMPQGGPYITDLNFEVDLPDGSAATGQEILNDLAAWLQYGFPEYRPPA